MTGNTFATARPPREARRGDIPDEMIAGAPESDGPCTGFLKGQF